LGLTCFEGIQLLVTALDYEKDAKYLNLRLRFEQQRLFAWSESSGLLDVQGKDHDRILNSNAFGLHRQTVLDLLMQIECLFKEFTKHQQLHKNLKAVRDEDGAIGDPERDAKQANFPMSRRHIDFIRKSMASLKERSKEGLLRMKWVSFDKAGFEQLLIRFTALNDKMTGMLDHRMQVEVHNTVQDTNRGVLLLHHKIDDLSQLVHALNSQLQAGTSDSQTHMSMKDKEANAAILQQLSRLAKFKAFHANIDPVTGLPLVIDEAQARVLDIPMPKSDRNLALPGRLVQLVEADEDDDVSRCEAYLNIAKGRKKVWIEWKDYDGHDRQPGFLSKADIVERVRRLATLLNHRPKPESFRTLHCLGYFDKADPNVPDDEVDLADRRLGLIFERPKDNSYDPDLPPLSLKDLILDPTVRKPRVTSRIALTRALSNCLLYLHAVNWLHKGLRSHNVLFFRDTNGQVDFTEPFLSGFDFSRPGGSEEMTDVPYGDAEHDLYRHPLIQSCNHSSRERSKKSFDIYSLGVIFIEIAHWQAIEDVLGIEMRRARGNADILRDVRKHLLNAERLWDIGAAMGQSYEDATRRCLRGEEDLDLQPGDDETTDEVARRLSGAFYKHVVKVLDEVHI
jgi:hypothetical protein